MRSKTTGELIEELERERDEIKERLVRAERTIEALRREVGRKRSPGIRESDDELQPLDPGSVPHGQACI